LANTGWFALLVCHAGSEETMLMDLIANIIVGIMIASTPLVFAAIGELVVEKSGVLNLGVEGMMIMGAITGFAMQIMTGNAVLALLAAMAGGALLALLFAVATQTLLANQVASGLALTLLGLGLSALFGAGFTGLSAPSFPRLYLPGLTELPFIGPVLFGQDLMVYLAFGLVAGVHYFLQRTRAGLVLRAVGENHDAAHAIGYPVIAIRYGAILFGGACAGLGGAYLTLVQTLTWSQNMTSGRGWIALALVVFATWRPWRSVIGAYLFGSISILQLHAQGLGVKVPSQLLSMLPYLATILVLVLISRDRLRASRETPASLGKVFHAAA
jgi:general nucleoside transport system permease protein